MAALDPGTLDATTGLAGRIRDAWQDAANGLVVPDGAPAQAKIDQRHFCFVLAKGIADEINDLGGVGGGGGISGVTIQTTAPLTGGSGTPGVSFTLGISAATTSAAGSMSAADKTKLDAFGAETGYLKADGTRPLTADWDVGNNKLTNLDDPTSAQDAATKAYVDGVIGGGSVNLYDVYANRPAAGASNVGAYFYATDKQAVYRCVQTGASTYAWKLVQYSSRVATDANDQVVSLFDDAVGTTAPANTGATGGSWTATGTPFTFGKEGPYGGPCAYCDGGSAWIRGFSAVAPTSLSVSVWVRSADSAANARIVHKLYAGATWLAPFFAAAISLGATTLARPEFYQTTGGFNTGAGAHLPPDRTNQEWTLLSWVYDAAASTYTTYVNGGRASQSTSRGAIDYGSTGTRDWVVGNTGITGVTSDPYRGLIADLRIADVARAQAYFQEQYRRGRGVWEG